MQALILAAGMGKRLGKYTKNNTKCMLKVNNKTLIERAIEEPLRQIAQNAGVEASVIVNKIREGKGDFGYNARTGEYVNMYEAGVIDPTKVARVALENAASVAGMLLTTECGIVDIPEPAPAAPAMPAGGMM